MLFRSSPTTSHGASGSRTCSQQISPLRTFDEGRKNAPATNLNSRKPRLLDHLIDARRLGVVVSLRPRPEKDAGLLDSEAARSGGAALGRRRRAHSIDDDLRFDERIRRGASSQLARGGEGTDLAGLRGRDGREGEVQFGGRGGGRGVLGRGAAEGARRGGRRLGRGGRDWRGRVDGRKRDRVVEGRRRRGEGQGARSVVVEGGGVARLRRRDRTTSGRG